MGLGSRSEDCCCCFGVRTGTLMLLYLELFCYVGLSLAIFNSMWSESTTTIHYSYTNSEYVYIRDATHSGFNRGGNEFLGPLFIGCLIMLVIILTGLFSIWKKKPSLLIPYFIIRILYAVIIIAIMPIFLFAEKLGLDAVNKPKAYVTVIEDFSGQESLIGKALSIISSALYFLMAIEVLLIATAISFYFTISMWMTHCLKRKVLQIHFAKVVYACYKQIQGAPSTSGGIILSAPSCNIPYTTLTNQYVYNHIPNQPVPYPSVQI